MTVMRPLGISRWILITYVALLSGAAAASRADATGSHRPFSASLLVQHTTPFMSPEVLRRQPLVYISYPPANMINVYAAKRPNRAPIGRITGLPGPSGLAVDREANLWVYESTGVEAFHRGSSKPFASFPAPPGFGLAVDRQGTVYVATTNRGIYVYPRGAIAPRRIIATPQFVQLWGVAVDRVGNIFCDGYMYVGSMYPIYYVAEISSSGVAPRPLMQLDISGWLAIGAHDDLFVQDVGNQTISTYAKPYTNGPTRSLTFEGSQSAVAFALAARVDDLWTLNVQAEEVSGARYDISNGKLLYQTGFQNGRQPPNGIAVDPAFIP